MVHISTVTSKGQVTIPVEIRRWLGLKQGDILEFARENGRIFLQPRRKPVDFTQFIGAVPDLLGGGTTEAWMHELRDEEDAAE